MAFPTGWTLLQKITIDNTKVSGAANLTDFPVYLSTSEFLSTTFDNTDNGGGDLRFSSDAAGTTQLSCEIAEWVTGTDAAEVYVKVPLVDYNDDTVIYVWGDNTTETQPAANAAFGSEDVWSNGYVGVWHLESDGIDSSGNSNTMELGNAPDYVTGKIGDGAEFTSGNGDYMTIADASATGLEITGSRTVSFWFKADAKTNFSTAFAHDSGSAGWIIYQNGWNYQFLIRGLTTNTYINSAVSDGADGTVVAGAWQHVVGVYDSTNTKLKIFMNNFKREVTASGSSSNSAADFSIGARDKGATVDLYADGIIDEVRVVNVARSDDWLTTVYNNQNSPSTFATGAVVSLIKELSGVAQASIKKVAGVAIASVKKVAGVSN